MEPATSAVISARDAGGGNSSTKGAHKGLKAIVRRKLGASGRVNANIPLKEDPKSDTRPGAVEAKLRAAQANGEAEASIAVRQLITRQIAESKRSGPVPPAMSNISGGAVKGAAGAANIGPVTSGSLLTISPPD
jgi:hypothetical protein